LLYVKIYCIEKSGTKARTDLCYRKKRDDDKEIKKKISCNGEISLSASCDADEEEVC